MAAMSGLAFTNNGMIFSGCSGSNALMDSARMGAIGAPPGKRLQDVSMPSNRSAGAEWPASKPNWVVEAPGRRMAPVP